MGRPEHLAELEEEVNCLEVHIQEVEAGKRAIETLDAEAAEAAEAAQRVSERVSAEERKKAQLEQRGGSLSAASRDPVALKRTLVVLRKRNKALQHLHNTCSGSAVPLEPQARTAQRVLRNLRTVKPGPLCRSNHGHAVQVSPSLVCRSCHHDQGGRGAHSPASGSCQAREKPAGSEP